ncbi:transglycosylase domain-containing protein [Clostridium akagii]|uniref:transglycosylase domain-containing protein n=1 Tax=Clostridium akagii TaxID=91623 RepID=UPI000691F138|nr:PBP1A family penicillin-binding protein [Clostridium akagii]
MANNTNGKKSSNSKTPNKDVKKKIAKKKKRPVLRFFKIFFLSFLCVVIIGSVATFGVVLAMIKTAPALDINGTILDLDQNSTLYDDKGQSMDTVITTQKRTVVSLSSIPKNLSHAFISIEDERFYQHGGIDVKRIASAMFYDVLSKIHRQNNIQGASTITQELIKQRMFLTDSLQNRISIKRKVQEAYLATELEKSLTKDQILEAYMNTIYLGGQANGVEAAAQQYFGTDVNNLNLIQSAFLAGLVQGPSKYYPLSNSAKKDPSVYINRTKTVLETMRENNYISDSDYTSSINDLNSGKLTFIKNNSSNSYYNYAWFSSSAVSAVKSDLKAQYNYTDEQVDNLLTNGGLKIYTTMDKTMEDSVTSIMNDTKSYGNASSSFSVKNGIRSPQSSATVTDYRTGQVKVLIGGTGQQPPASYNRSGTSYNNPVGSSMKPLAVYAPGIDTKAITESTVVDDSPLSPEISNKYVGSDGKPYQPKDDNGYSGPQTIKTAITNSINVIAVKVEDKIGVSIGASYAQKFGLTLDDVDKNPTSIAAMALGQLNHGSNTTAMSSAYGTFGNGGVLVTPKVYTKVVDSKGAVILDNTQPTSKRVISADAAYIMYDMLKGPVSSSGTGSNASKYTTMPVAGKTGTTTNSFNLWFCGLSPYYSAAVWIGNDKPTALSSTFNSNVSANVWGLIMADVTKNQPIKDLTAPDDLTNIGGNYYIDGTAPTVIAPPVTPPAATPPPQNQTTTNNATPKVDNTVTDTTGTGNTGTGNTGTGNTGTGNTGTGNTGTGNTGTGNTGTGNTGTGNTGTGNTGTTK